MAYPLSASRLQSYHRCPQAYNFQYERRIPTPPLFSPAELGKALHRTLAQVYWDWPYQEPEMPWSWVERCWQEQQGRLSLAQQVDGFEILSRYYRQYLLPEMPLKKPLGVEGKIQASFQVGSLEFSITGRYDRLQWLETGLELIDYKSAKNPQLPDPASVDVQMGLYYLALEQRYQQSLRQMSLLFLRTGEKVTFTVTPEHKQQVLETIRELAMKLQTDQDWQPQTGRHCDRCAYRRYCAAVQTDPEPLPLPLDPACRTSRPLQLALSFSS